MRASRHASSSLPNLTRSPGRAPCAVNHSLSLTQRSVSGALSGGESTIYFWAPFVRIRQPNHPHRNGCGRVRNGTSLGSSKASRITPRVSAYISLRVCSHFLGSADGSKRSDSIRLFARYPSLIDNAYHINPARKAIKPAVLTLNQPVPDPSVLVQRGGRQNTQALCTAVRRCTLSRQWIVMRSSAHNSRTLTAAVTRLIVVLGTQSSRVKQIYLLTCAISTKTMAASVIGGVLCNPAISSL